jgi:hypothetical protein
MFVNYTWFWRPVAPLEMPIDRKHLDPDFCCCDPIIQVDGDDDDLVAVGWFDRFGIQRMAVDRALLGGKDELEGVFVTLLKGDPI